MGVYSIRDIELITGIKAHTLRIWEQRYSIPTPKRTETNIRFYDDDDLKLLLNISLLNQNGHKISEITRLDPSTISELAVNYSLKSEKDPVHIQTMIAAMIELDEVAFEKILSTCILQSGLEHTIMEVVFPFLTTIGMLWQTGTVDAGYEHFATNIIRQKMIVAIEGQVSKKETANKKFMLFLPETELHELGLLFANYMIRNGGQHTLYLGQNVPLEDVMKIGKRYEPNVIMTSMTSTFSQEYAKEVLERLRSEFPKSKVVVTGRFFTLNHDMITKEMELVSHPDDLKKLL
jgi:methanogenic corrinoid protein MtbC1